MPVWSDLPVNYHERVPCAIMASIKYQVPANILLAIAEKEAGKPGQWVKNANGSYDIGSMQLNTTYLKDLAQYGIKPTDVAQKGCFAYDLAAWRVRRHLVHDRHDLWTRAANYHSKTPKYNQIYRADLIKKARKWQQWLEVHFRTYTVSSPGAAPIHLKQDNRPNSLDGITMRTETTPPTHRNLVTTHRNIEAEKALAAVFSPERRDVL